MSEFVSNNVDSGSDWKWVTLADVGKVITGNTPPTSDAENYGDAIPFVKPTELVDRGIRSAPSGLATQAIGKARVVPAGAVLVSCIGNLGKTGIAKVPVAFNQQINAVVFNENVLPEFGFYFAQTLKPWLYGESSATTIPIVNKGKFQQVRFPLVPMSEQRRIVAEIEKQFSRLDEAVANLQRVKANLKRYKSTVLQSAIEGKLIKSVVNFSDVSLQSLIGRITQGWSPKCDLNREALPDEWAVITTTAVQPMQYFDNQGKPLPADLIPRPVIEIKKGDFLMTRKGPRKRAGVACLVRATRHRLMVCDTVYRFRCDESVVKAEYLEIALNAPKVVDAIDHLKAGISESGVSLTHNKLGSVLIPLPPLEHQAKIVAEVDRHLSIIREVEAEVDTNLQRAKALRQATLAKAFSVN